MIRMHRTLCLFATLLAGACSLPGDQATRTKDAGSYPGLRFDTSAGSFTAVLYPEAAPETVARYLEYVDSGYFSGRSFDRVVPGFVIQLTDCAISAATRDDRTLPLEAAEGYYFSAGALGIARAADPNSGGAEFFVMDFAAAHLNTQYTVWGQVIEGMEVVRQAARVQAIDFTTGGLPAVVGDRCAIQPVEINSISRISIDLDAAQAARLPLHTAERVRTDDAAYNLEWPATLAARAETGFAAYITMIDKSQAPPAAASVQITVDGQTLAVEGEAGADGIYHFSWTPPGAGDYDVTLSAGGNDLATWLVSVPGN